MNILHLAHAGEDHGDSVSSAKHTLNDNPVILLLLATAVVLLVAALVVYLMGRERTTAKKEVKSKDKDGGKPTES